MKKLNLSLIALILCFSIISIILPTNTLISDAITNSYYVSTQGDDNNLGTELSPWRTIQKAVNEAMPGDTIYVRSGTYHEKVTMQRSGTAEVYITLRNYPNESPVIDMTGVECYGYGWGGAIDTNEKNYLIIQGMHIQNVNADGLEYPDGFGIGQGWRETIVGSEHIIVRDCSTLNTSNSGIMFINGADITIDNCLVDNACFDSTHGALECISLDNVNGYTVSNCTVRNITNDVPGMGGEGIDVKNGSSNGEIFGNTVYNIEKVGIYVDAYSATQSNTEVYENEVYNAGQGIAIAAEVSGGLIQDCNVYDNTVHHITDFGFVIGWADCGAIDSLVIDSNITHNMSSGSISLLIDNDLATNVDIINNEWDANNGIPMYASAWDQGEFTITGNTPTNTVVTP